MNIFGISAFYYDCVAVLRHSIEIVAAAQEERYVKKKYDSDFPKYAVDYCLPKASITFVDVKSIARVRVPLGRQ